MVFLFEKLSLFKSLKFFSIETSKNHAWIGILMVYIAFVINRNRTGETVNYF